ncbi:MAG: laccase domain-containing protein [Ruminococcaceae bacterium]|nr:laccase domain-containing protein [Oscillospiraceae bacterium]
MYRYEQNDKNDVVLLKFDRLAEKKNIVHCFTTRIGGVSKGACETLNMSFKRDTDRDNVTENIKRVAVACGVPFESVTMVPQVHAGDVKVITSDDAGRGVSREVFDDGYDAMVTNVKGVTLATIHGDCIPVFLYDENSQSVGMIHSGWRSTHAGISANAVSAMEKNYGASPENIIAVIGPGICQDCFEASEDVYNAFAEKYGADFSEDTDVCRPDLTRTGKWYISLPGIVCKTLIAAGVPEKNIVRSGICTCCVENKDKYFSHRREKGNTGAMSGFIMLK